MNLDIFVMNGYGVYVWSAFAFSFLVCFILFVKTKRTLKKLENEFKKEAMSLSDEKVSALKNKKVAQEILNTQQKAH
tara:strand:- start:1187 stop:1417 length:231 start_codon:yes stop_codon:yes gene_type:complete